MKILFCPLCWDAKKLQRERTECRCGQSWGRYEADGLNSTIGGAAKILGVANPDVQEALMRPDHSAIRCWMMDEKAPHVRKEAPVGRRKKATKRPA